MLPCLSTAIVVNDDTYLPLRVLHTSVLMLHNSGAEDGDDDDDDDGDDDDDSGDDNRGI